MRIHLDTDLGGDIDDLCALALLLGSPEAEIAGITTVLEDRGRRAGYVRYALTLAGRAGVPVAAGAGVENRLGPSRYGADLPPESRYWPERVQPAPGPLDEALDLLQHNIELGATVVAIGPFTNLALLKRRRPGLLRHAALYLMGGKIRPAPLAVPNWEYTFDYNVQADSTAARQVLEASNPTIIPIEITAQTAPRRAQLPELALAGPLGRLLARQAEACAEDEQMEDRFGRTYAGLPDDLINFQHDPLAVAVALGWDGVTIERVSLALRSEANCLRLEERPEGRPFAAVTAVDGERFNEFWYRRVLGA